MNARLIGVFINYQNAQVIRLAREGIILKNNYLPGMPSEADVLKNGYDINEMDAKLLEQIEKLYLQVIALEKEVRELKAK